MGSPPARSPLSLSFAGLPSFATLQVHQLCKLNSFAGWTSFAALEVTRFAALQVHQLCSFTG